MNSPDERGLGLAVGVAKIQDQWEVSVVNSNAGDVDDARDALLMPVRERFVLSVTSRGGAPLTLLIVATFWTEDRGLLCSDWWLEMGDEEMGNGWQCWCCRRRDAKLHARSQNLGAGVLDVLAAFVLA